MHEVQANSIRCWFREFVDRFRQDDGSSHPMIELKIGHTARVATLCRGIAEGTGWPSPEVLLGEVAGWLHDVGRFSQWEEFGTYYDEVSVDHASRGCEVILREGVIDALEQEERSRVLDAVAFHNRRELPESVPASSLGLCRLVRDADKLDILDLTYRSLVDGTLCGTQPALSREVEANPVLLAEIATHRRASYGNMKTLSDFVLVSVSWAYDFNFAATARMVREGGMLSRLASHLPATEDVRGVLRDAEAHLGRLGSTMG